MAMKILPYSCMDGIKIPFQNICDGLPHCVDSSDETAILCHSIRCPLTTFKCAYGACISQNQYCDGFVNCIDESDELFCDKDAATTLTMDSYRVKNHQNYDCNNCLQSSSKDDIYTDCYGWSIEYENTCKNLLFHGACHLPLAQSGTSYNIKNCKSCCFGNIVSEFTRLEYNCSKNMNMEGASVVYCQNSHWFPSLPTCLSARSFTKCSIINSPGTIKYCKMNWNIKANLTSCNQPLPIGTIMTMKCRDFYEREQGSTHIMCLHDGTWSQIPLSCRPICGIKTPSLTTMIVRGWNTSPEENFPWHATLYSHANGLWNFFCGGTLISERIVLTAGHCVWKISPDTIKVLLNSNSSDFSNQNKETQIHDVHKIFIHNSYQDLEGNYGSDLAIIIFKYPALMHARVLPACIDWLNKYDITQRSGEIGFIAGMGITENDTFSSNLRVVSAQIISEDICRKKEIPDFRKYLSYTSFCAGWANGTGVCNGDSGGGFLLPRPNSNIWEVHGIVSLSPRRLGAFLCDPNYYTVFTKVSPYINWIKKIVQSVSVTEDAGLKNTKYQQ